MNRIGTIVLVSLIWGIKGKEKTTPKQKGKLIDTENRLMVARGEKGRKKVKVKLLSRVRLFRTPWTVAYQASQSIGFSRQEYWSGLPFPSPGNLPDPGSEPRSPAL